MSETNRNILITGCSSGIGHAAAHTLKQRGWRVFATCRQAADCERLQGEGLESLRLDYEDPPSIAAAADAVLERCQGELTALFNNGAYGLPGAVEDVPVAGLRAIFEANFFGWHELTRRVIPVMRQQGHGRIVQNSSVLGFAAVPMRGAYTATKFALEGLTDTLRLELRGSGIHVALIEPGPIDTKFRENALRQFQQWIDRENTVHRSSYEQQLHRLTQEKPLSPHTLPPDAVVRKLIHALESPRPRPRYYVTRPTYVAGILRRLLPTTKLDNIMARQG